MRLTHPVLNATPRRLEEVIMATARSTLEALLVNDPEHPAIREFVIKAQEILAIAAKEDSTVTDAAALHLIRHEMGSLEKRLRC